MKLVATVVIFALVCHLAIGDNTTATNTTATNTTSTNTTATNTTSNTTATNTTATNTTATNTTATNTTNATTPAVVRLCKETQYWNGTGCSACPGNCGLCVLKNKAVSCNTCLNDNQFLKISADGLGSCANCSANCAKCRGPEPMDCILPVDGFSVNPITKTIVACKAEHCQYCDVTGNCSRCSYKFMRTNTSACTPCTGGGCAECPVAASNCTKCLNGYSLNGTSCLKCSEGCENCKADGNCTICAPGYDLSNGKCVQHTCADNCVNCDANKVCTACAPAYHLNKTGNTTTCLPCSAHCGACDDKGCTTCLEKSDENGFHYGLNTTTHTCIKCNDPNCKTCDGNGVCTACYNDFGGFYLDDKKTCVKCTDGCQECTAAGCTKCRALNKLIGTTNATCKSYSSCILGQQMDNAGVCSAGTIDNCYYGDATAKTCLVCANGYFPDGSGCSPCPSGCLTCAKDAAGYLHCAQPFSGEGFSALTNNATKIDATGYLCRSGCKTCSKSGNCTSCMPNHLFTQSLVHTGAQFCLQYESCPHPVENLAPIMCYSDLTNQTQDVNTPNANAPKNTFASKLAMSFISAIALALYVL